MTSRKLKLKVRRQYKKSRKQVEGLGFQAGEQIDKNLIRRISRLVHVRRFVLSWLLLVLLIIGSLVAQTIALGSYYQTLKPEPGGVYNEGILGDFTNANPVYATTAVDSSVSKLVFSGLLTYNNKNKLIGDLASSWSINDSGTVYTVHLKPNLKWQDGKPLTSSDVLFTYQVIDSPDAQSPLFNSWQGITVAAPDPLTVTFSLPNPLSSFPYSLTTGIIPKHLLSGIPMAQMRSASFNTTDPVGSGPFQFSAIEVRGDTPQTREESIELTPYKDYYGGTPKLNEFVVRAYHDQDNLINAFNNNELTAVSGLTSLPSNLKQGAGIEDDSFPLTAEVMTFFKTSTGVLSDVKVRQALVTGADTISLIDHLGYPTIAVKEPLLEGQLGFNPLYVQASFNQTAAKTELASDGWVARPDGILYKGDQPLSFTLTASSSPEYSQDAMLLQKQWRAIGVNVSLSLQDDTDLQNSVNYHSYDAVLYGISIGVDPDVFVYWDSSQADPRSASRLNLSEFKSAVSDDSLEEGRTRSDPTLRAIKYIPFLQDWQQQAPALGLYQPRYLYITNGHVSGLSEETINTSTDRYNNIVNWEIRQSRVTD